MAATKLLSAELLAALAGDGEPPPPISPAPPAEDACYAAVQAVRAGDVPPAKLPAALTVLGVSDASAAALADAMWYAWVQAEAAGSEEQRGRLADAAGAALAAGLLTKRLLMETGEGEFLEHAGLVVSYRDGFRKREIRANTRHVYTQRKFNLLREESEGYAKLVALLNRPGAAAAAAAPELRALVGFFDLDPARCCSLVLDAFAAAPGNAALADLAAGFGGPALGQLLGFNFGRVGAPEEALPPGLYAAAAQLVAAGHVPLEALVAHFAATDEQVAAAWAEGCAALDAAVGRIGVISLTAAAPDDGQPAARRTGQSAAALDLDARPLATHLLPPALVQRAHLLAALLAAGPAAWPAAQRLLRWLAALGVTDPAGIPVVGAALCAALAGELRAAPPAEGPLTPRARELLAIIGHHMYHDVATLTRVTRALAAALRSDPGDAAAADALGAHVLPAASMVPGNAALALEVWDALCVLPYPRRFALYGELRDAAEGAPLLRASARLAETEVRRILRRVTAPASRREAKLTMRPLGRMLAKITHANPAAVADQLLRQVMGMPGMVASISEALKYLTPAAFDVATHAILRHLASRSRRKLKEDGINLEEWFQWLAAFTGVLARKHEAVEVTALGQYVANSLKGGDSLDTVVLWELVAALTGVAPVFEVSDAQMDALAGSEALLAQAVAAQADAPSAAGERAAARGTARLLRALTAGDPAHRLAVPLLILLAQQRKLITLAPGAAHLKAVAEQYDRCQEAVAQYAQFLRKALSPGEYAAALPSIADLALEYRVDADVIFELHRPTLKAAVPPLAPLPEEAEEGEAAAEEGPPRGETAVPAGEASEAEEGAMDVEDGEVAAPAPAPAPAAAPAQQMDWEALTAQTAVLAPEGGFRGMSQTLFVTFWALELYDLDVPAERYAATTAQVRAAARAARDDLEAARRDAQRPAYGGRQGFNAPAAPAAVDVEALAREAERLEALAARLPADQAAQEANAAAVAARLRSTAGAWVAAATPEAEAAAAREFVQHCVLPRVVASPGDALYCARFLATAHALGPPGFRLLGVVDRLFRELGFLVRAATPREATNLGIFFAELQGMVARWRGAAAFAAECAASEAFRSYKAGALTAVTHPEFVKLSANWHRKLTLDVFRTCLASADYMQMKNALLVLNRLVRVYPATKEDIAELLRALAPIADADPREDLKTLARMYTTALEMAQRGDRGRAVVATRQEYAGLPPPPRKKKKKVEEGGGGERRRGGERDGGRAAPEAAKPAEEKEKREERERERGAKKEEGGGGGGRRREEQRDVTPRDRGADRDRGAAAAAASDRDRREPGPRGGGGSSRDLREKSGDDRPVPRGGVRGRGEDRAGRLGATLGRDQPQPQQPRSERDRRDRDPPEQQQQREAKRQRREEPEPPRRGDAAGGASKRVEGGGEDRAPTRLDLGAAKAAARAATADRSREPQGRDRERPRSAPDEPPRDRRDDAPRDRRDEAPRERRDEAPKERRDEGPKERRERQRPSPEAGDRDRREPPPSPGGADSDDGGGGRKSKKQRRDERRRRDRERKDNGGGGGGGDTPGGDEAPARLRGRLGSSADEHRPRDRSRDREEKGDRRDSRGGGGGGGGRRRRK